MMCEGDGATAGLVDVWNSKTFGNKLRAELLESQAIIEAYHSEEARLGNLDRDEHLVERLQGNRFSEKFEELQRRVAMVLAEHQIRVWHYTRLFDFEIESMKRGIELSSDERMKARLSELSRREHITEEEFEALLDGSVLKTQKNIRENRFFCVPTPIIVTDSGVEPLLGNWGGEVVYFHQHDEALKQRLGLLGLPRVIEISVRISDPLSRYSLAGCVLNTCAIDLGIPLRPSNIDLCIKEDPPPARVIAVHTQGEKNFLRLGRNYPDGADMLLTRCDGGAISLTNK